MTCVRADPAARRRGVGRHAPGGGSSSLADVVALILDKGLVIDVFVRVSLVGIEILTSDARIVVDRGDTYLRFAEATNRFNLLLSIRPCHGSIWAPESRPTRLPATYTAPTASVTSTAATP